MAKRRDPEAGPRLGHASRGVIGLTLLVAFGAALRLRYNNVIRFGNGDEYHYRLQLQEIYTHGWQAYPGLVKTHLAFDPDFPAPYRWGVLAVGRLACTLRHACDERSLAWVSTVSGCFVVALIAILGASLFRRSTARVATALAITSPLHLDLGRRAYVDELHTACLLLAFFCLARVAMQSNSDQKPKRGLIWAGMSILVMTFAWSVKESILFFMPALLAWLAWLRRPPRPRPVDLAIVLLPPACFIAGFVWLNHGFSPLGDLLLATRHSFLHRYSLLNQYGPPHRPLIELFALSPVVFGLLPVVPFAAFGMAYARPNSGIAPELQQDDLSRRHAQALFLAWGLIALAFCFLPKNLRFFALLDPLARLLVAWFLCEVLPIGRSLTFFWWAALLLGQSAIELALFHRTFVVSSVTDPTASAVLRALSIVPNDALTKSWRPPALVIVCGLLSAGFAWIAALRSRFNRRAVLGAAMITACALGLPQLFRSHRAIAAVAPNSTSPAPPVSHATP